MRDVPCQVGRCDTKWDRIPMVAEEDLHANSDAIRSSSAHYLNKPRCPLQDPMKLKRLALAKESSGQICNVPSVLRCDWFRSEGVGRCPIELRQVENLQCQGSRFALDGLGCTGPVLICRDFQWARSAKGLSVGVIAGSRNKHPTTSNRDKTATLNTPVCFCSRIEQPKCVVAVYPHKRH